MPNNSFPGVYIEESRTPPLIEGVSTSITGMVGPTERGPLAPRLVTSLQEFQHWYGSLPAEQSFLPFAVQGFFENGGQRLYIARVTGQYAGFASDRFGRLHIQALGPGSWGDRLFVRLGKASQAAGPRGRFRLTLLYFSEANLPPDPANVVDPSLPGAASHPNYRQPDALEDFDDLVYTPGDVDDVCARLNTASRLVRVWLAGSAPGPHATRRRRGEGFTRLAGGTSDGQTLDGADFAGDSHPVEPACPDPSVFGQGRGLSALAEIGDISLLLAPDEVNPAIPNAGQITTALIDQCERLQDRLALLSASTAADYRTLQPPQDTSYAAFYYPWIEVKGTTQGRSLFVPPVGHVAGVIARTDREQGVHTAPANQELRGVLSLQSSVTTEMQELLNPRGVNCLRDFRTTGRGIRLWGARTASSDPEWKYINVRRLCLYIEESIEQGLQWVAFEPNSEPLWASVRMSITNFLHTLWRSGALVGQTAQEAYFMRCDRTTMTQEDIDHGRLICLIGIAPLRPAEFVILRFGLKTAEAH